ncbi:glycosyltransferase family 39 protein [Paenibacillus sp. sptzw28]|uniref:ArnT family glycosyltransferase n=1 Tax=Paenibacillus sp. sptzw28 TaxID=715179 RepID=UPI001C6EC57B|nr:glycosyltransferase family 39 protein [Paenibacillus sp. sptzw28]
MRKATTRLRGDIYLALILLLSVVLNGYNIWTDKYANTYYTTAVASMLQSFHNFFYGSLDPAGSVTVDKPPLTFWIQTASAYIFGLHGWSVILPQALAGVGSVVLVYLLLKPTFGLASARIGALVMACMPVAVAVSRTNNIDSMLVFTLLLGAWLLFRGVRKTNVWSVLGGFAMIGAGFNMKMLQAYMVLPAFYLFYIIAARTSWKKKIAVLAGATAVMLVISLSWAVIVDSIPASKRPYIGSSQTNSVLELAFGYNGIARLTGQQGGGGGGAPGTPSVDAVTNQADGASNPGVGSQAQSSGGAQTGGSATGTNFGGGMGQPPGFNGSGGFPERNGMGGMFGTGNPGPLRLFQSELSGQASWLVPLALFGCIGLFAGLRRRSITQKHKETLFWLAWLVPVMAFFSVAGFFHQYYLIMLAPPLAALVGAGWIEMWDSYRNRSGFISWLLPAAVLATTVFEWYILQPYGAKIGNGWPIVIATAGMLLTLLLIGLKRKERTFGYAAQLTSLLLLLVGPLYWAATPITYGQNSMLPQAGPGSNNGMGSGPNAVAAMAAAPTDGTNTVADGASSGANGGSAAATGGEMPTGMPGGMPGGMGSGGSVDNKTLSYLIEHNTGEAYLFATFDYNTAAPYIIDARESVVTLGGFSGSDPVYSVAELEALVASGKLKYFMISGGGMGGGRGGSSELTQWITGHGTIVPASEWQTTTGSGNASTASFGGRGGSMTLYEVKL